ncbi:MAG: hypothetical protein ABFS86_18190, partial [Planctomycetota bacterium]
AASVSGKGNGKGAGDGEVFKKDRAEVAPFPREVPLGKQTEIRVRPAPSHHTPILAVTDPKGEVRYVKPLGKDDEGWHRFSVDFPEGAGAYRFELVVDSNDKGDVTAAQFTIWVGVERPKERIAKRSDSDYDPEPEDAHPLVLERKLFRLVNEYRKSKRREAFPWLEDTAVLGRAHLTDYLKLKPRPKSMVHKLPFTGTIADRFADLHLVQTSRKFPVAEPDIGPEAIGYISESLATLSSIDWLFEQYYLKESAFRKPIQSKYPTHASVAMIRHPDDGKLLAAFIYVQINSTRVLKTIEEKKKETVRLESRARDPEARAVFLRQLGRQGDPKSIAIYRRRLSKAQPPPVRGAALDALILNAPEQYRAWVERHAAILEKAGVSEDYAQALPVLLALAQLEWDPAARTSAQRKVRFITRLSNFEIEAAEERLLAGDREAAREHFETIAKRFPGLPAAKRAKIRAEALKEPE